MAKQARPTPVPVPQKNFAPARTTGRPVVRAVQPVEVPEMTGAPAVAEPAPQAPAAKVKRTRYARGKADEKTVAVPLPARSRTFSGKMMSSGVVMPHKAKPVTGTRDAKGPPQRGGLAVVANESAVR